MTATTPSMPRTPRGRGFQLLLCASLALCLSSVPCVEAYYAETATTVPPGFNVYDVRQDEGTQRMHVILNISGGDQVHPLLYFTPKQDGTEGTGAGDTFDVNNHPCVSAPDDICCLKRFYEEYGILDAPGLPGQVCDSEGTFSSIQSPSSQDSSLAPLSFPGTLDGSNLFEGAESAYKAGMSVTMEGAGSNRQVTLKFPIDYLDQNTGGGAHARVSKTGEHEWKYEFYVGVVFISTRTDSAGVRVQVLQHNIEFTKSQYMFFSVASQQERTPVQSVDMFVHQGKASDNRLMQYVEFFMGYDRDVYDQVSVTLPSIKYAKAASYDTAVWKLPCGETGFREGANRSFYDEFENLACLPHDPHFCECVGGRLWIPFNQEDATAEHGYIAGPDFENVIFIQMMVELVEKATGDVVEANVFASVDLSSYPVLEHCTTSITEFQSVADVIHVSASTGIEGDTGTPLSLSVNFTGGVEEIGADADVKPSYASAALSLEFNMGRYFMDDFGRANEMHIDSLVVMNFLADDGVVYDAMKRSIAAGHGFSVVRTEGGPSVQLNIVPNIDAGSCERVQGTDLSGVNFNCMWREVVNDGAVVPAFQESVFLMDTMAVHTHTQAEHEGAVGGPYGEFLEWFDTTYLTGTTPDSTRGRDYLYSRCKGYDGKLSADAADIAYAEKTAYTPLKPHGDYSCLFIDPGYRWVSRAVGQTVGSSYDISDKTIVAGILTIRGTNGVISGRRLLTFDGDGVKLRQLDEADDEGGGGAGASEAAASAAASALREADLSSEERRYAAVMRSVERKDGVERMSSPGPPDAYLLDAQRRLLDAKTRVEHKSAQSAAAAATAAAAPPPRMQAVTKRFSSVDPHVDAAGARGAGPRDATGQLVPHRRLLDAKARLEARYLRSQEKHSDGQRQEQAPPRSLRAAAARGVAAAEGSTQQRHLLAAEDAGASGSSTTTDEQEYINQLRAQTANAVLSVSNAGVDANVNIAHMTGHANARWQVFSAEMQRAPSVPWAVFKANLDTMMLHAGGNLGPGVRSGNITGYYSTPPRGAAPADAAAAGRRLLQLVSADGFGATVRLSGILRMSAKFGALYAHMFKCMLAAGAHATFPITHLSALNETRACASQADAGSETQAVVDALLGDCGFGAEKLSLEVCNTLYQPLLFTAPTVAFDWYHIASSGEQPVLFFTLEPGIEITPTNEAAAVYSARTNLAGVFAVPMDRILIEVRDAVAGGGSAARRRLLQDASQKVFHVWIYADDGNRGNGAPFPPAGAAPADVYAAQRDNVVQSLAGVLGEVGVPAEAETAATGFTLQATMPRLKRFATEMQVDVSLSGHASLPPPRTARILAVVKEQVAGALAVGQLELRVLATFVLLGTDTVRVVLEVRSDSAAATRAHVRQLQDLADGIAASIEAELEEAFRAAGWDNTIHAVKIPTSSINTVFDGTVGGDDDDASGGDGLGAGAIVGIIAACLVVVAVLARAVVEWRAREHEPTAPAAAGKKKDTGVTTPANPAPTVTPAAGAGNASAYSMHGMQWQLAAAPHPYQALSPYDIDPMSHVGSFAPPGRAQRAPFRV